MDDSNNIDTKLLQETIDDLKNNPDACSLTEGMISESDPGEQLGKFIDYLGTNGIFDMDYVNNYEKIKDKNIEDYTTDEVLTALTRIIRSDRFVSGELYSRVKDGTVLKLLEKLKG